MAVAYEKSSQMSIGLGLIGMGRHGSRYARHLLDGIPGCHLVAVSRRNQQEGERFAQAWGIDFSDWRALLERRDIDAVLVVTPPSMNLEICLAAAKAGKALLVEKPLARNTHEAEAMIQAARAGGVALMTAQTLRFTPVLCRFRESLGTIGPLEYLLLSMRAEPAPHRWLDDPCEAGGGVLLEIGIHLLDLIRFLTGDEPVEVSAEIAKRHTRNVEDMAWARFRLRSGAWCYVEVSRVSIGRSCRVEAIGAGGQLLADVQQSVLTRIEGRKVIDREGVPDRPTLIAALAGFARSLETGSAMPITGEDGLRAVAMAEAAYRSASELRPIPITWLSDAGTFPKPD
jgi:predicted dehydrogenase